MTGLNATHKFDLLNDVLSRLRVVRRPDERGEHVCWCPFHADGQGKPPHQPNLHVSERGYICHACGEKGGLRELAERLGVPIEADAEIPVATYDYQDEAGTLLFQICRFPGKKFSARRPTAYGGWVHSLDGTRRVLYRLPEVCRRSEDAVYVVEGEKDSDRLASEGLLSTTNPFGAGKWRKEHAEALRGRDVIIIPDNDEAGRKFAEVLTFEWDGTNERGDKVATGVYFLRVEAGPHVGVRKVVLVR